MRDLLLCRWAALTVSAALPAFSFMAPASAEDAMRWALQGQVTGVVQYHPSFHSAYRGDNSLDPGSRGNETVDATLYAGARPWSGTEIWFNPEIDQGFGLSNTLGLAGFASGEAYKVGKSTPYLRVQRAFVRQTFELGGGESDVAADTNRFGSRQSADTLVFTVGKFSVTDIFDGNAYSHDPKVDFLNWSLIDAGAFDYAADAWGYSYGFAAEWTQSWWTLRAGIFDLSTVPNATSLETGFGQYEGVVEGEARNLWSARPGTLKLLAYMNRGQMGSYDAALRAVADTGGVPQTAAVRRRATRSGAALNADQEIADGIGLFVRVSANDGKQEAFEFTEINRSVSGGISIKGNRWARPRDVLGIGLAINRLSSSARAYFTAGGLGILIGDGGLRYGDEKIIETYYRVALVGAATLGFDYQAISNPAYNRDRGPVSALAVRVHAAF